VVLDADELSTDEGKALAERFMAETILVTSPKDSQASFGLRYFVPRHEMEMCVHGTIAAVTVLRRLDRIATSPVWIETALGLISVEWSEKKQDVIATVNQFVPEFATRNPHAEEVAEALGLPETSSIRVDLPIASVSTSRFKLMVPLKSVETLDRLCPDFDALWSLCDKYGTTGLYPFAPVSARDGGVYAARQFPNRAGYNEDPATGVAACALGAYLSRFDTKSEGWNTFEVLQGQAMGRPSRLVVKAFVEAGSVRKIAVMGKAEILGRGNIPNAL